MQKIIPSLWFVKNAKEAVDYYLSVFPNSKILSTSYYPENGDNLPDFQKEFAGKELTIEIELNGQRFTILNAGPFKDFNESISFQVFCKDQEEIDYYWEKLSAVPEAEQCGWCKDKYGLSWQIVPENIEELMKKPNAWNTMMNQHKIIISEY